MSDELSGARSAESTSPLPAEQPSAEDTGCECAGTGKLSREIPPAPFRDIGNGLQIGGGGGYTSELCSCRASLEPRDGEARWWSSETVFEEYVDETIFQRQHAVTVKAEVPISDDNYRVRRYGNRYYPTFVEIGNATLFPDEARKLGEALIAGANAAESIDEPDTDPCGHWAPCHCPLSPVPEDTPR